MPNSSSNSNNKKKIRFLLGFLIGIILVSSVIISASNTLTNGAGEQELDDITMEYKSAEAGKGLEEGAENEHLKLYFDHDTGGVVIEEKQTGKLFYSSPPEALEDEKASDIMKQQLSSSVLVTYYDTRKKTENNMSSYADALSLGQIAFTNLEDGIRVRMTLGREDSRRVLPVWISKEAFEGILEKIESSRTARQIQAFYILYSLEGLDEAAKEDLLRRYPALETMDLYILKSSASERDKSVLEEAVISTGYTMEMLEEEYEKVGHSAEDDIFPYFKLEIDYKLEGELLSVSIDTDKIEYDSSIFYLTNLSLLNYFGAGKTGEEGYLFLPDGSGTLIYFNNSGAKRTLLTRGKTYGPDGAEITEDRGSFKNEFRFPVYGVKTGDTAIIGMIDKGDAVSEINGELGNINHSYNAAYAGFVIRRKETFVQKDAFEQTPWVMYDKTGYRGEIKVAYGFLTGEDADYAGMAKTYQKYLEAQGHIEKLEDTGELPFVLETIGAVKRPEKTLGIPMVKDAAVTSFEDAYQMLTGMNALGVNNIKLRYQAWYNGGYYHTAASKMKASKVLGGAKGLSELNQKAEAIGAEVYPDINFMYHYSDKSFDGYSKSKDGIRNLFQKAAYYPELAVATLTMEDWYYIVNPSTLMKYFNNFTKEYDKLGIENVSLGSTGKVLNSNYKNNNYVNRETAKEYVEELLEKADEKYQNIMVNYGNAYTLDAADYILKLPVEDSGYLIAEESVPFMQLVLHGYVYYSGEALNISSMYERDLLKYIEYGCIPYFLLCYRDSSILKEAYIFDAVYSVDFENWKEEAARAYSAMNQALSGVIDVPIMDHEKVMEKVYKTSYENGTVILVNYSEEDVTVNGVLVKALDYAVTKDSERR